MSANGAPAPGPVPPDANRAEILNAVSSPLAFFGLALLIIEAPFPVMYGLSDKSVFEFWLCMAVMGGLIVGVVLAVTLLTVFAPKSLIQKVADEVSDKLIAEQEKTIERQNALARGIGVQIAESLKQVGG